MQDLRAQGRPVQEGVRVPCYVRRCSFLWRYGCLEEDLFHRLSAAKDLKCMWAWITSQGRVNWFFRSICSHSFSDSGLYTDESPGLKVDPVIVLVLSLVFIFSVVALHSTSYQPKQSAVAFVVLSSTIR